MHPSNVFNIRSDCTTFSGHLAWLEIGRGGDDDRICSPRELVSGNASGDDDEDYVFADNTSGDDDEDYVFADNTSGDDDEDYVFADNTSGDDDEDYVFADTTAAVV